MRHYLQEDAPSGRPALFTRENASHPWLRVSPTETYCAFQDDVSSILRSFSVFATLGHREIGARYNSLR